MKSLVSIAMATYNGELYLKEQLDSILDQTYNNLEIIICDDLSNDKTIEIIKEYQKLDSRIQLYINETNLGFKNNFEKAISLCKGDFIALADQDDIWEENKIEVLTDCIGQYDLIHSAASLIDENSNIISPLWIKQDDFKYTFTKLVFRNTITGCTLLFKKELLKEFSPIPSGEKYHDWWLALLASKNNGITYYDKPLTKYRQHSNQDTGSKIEDLFSKLKRIVTELINKKDSNRYMNSQLQVERLESFLLERNKIFSKKEIIIITDALNYHKNYLVGFLHIRTFLVSIKYYDSIYYKNKYYLKTILKDLIS